MKSKSDENYSENNPMITEEISCGMEQCTISNRNINNVIKDMIKIIPEDQIKLINELNKYSKDTWNIAPELLSNGIYFREVGNILNTNIPNVDCDWKKQLVIIFNN